MANPSTRLINVYGERVRKLVSLDLSNIEIAEILNVERNAVRRIRRHLELPSFHPSHRTRRKAYEDPPLITTERKCLKCGRTFDSDGPGNRVCELCKKTSSWRMGGDYTMAVV